MLKEFYTVVLPSQGVYCVTVINNGRAQNKFAESIEEVVEKLEQNKNYNVFVALSSFKNHSRKADNAQYSRSFFIDLDVDPANPQKYPSKSAALAALAAFLDSYGLPPPIRVDSGSGIHAYWPFNEDILIEEWKPYAEKFKAYCLDKMLIDPTVTADAARVMRAPDSSNYKTDPPKPTLFLDTDLFPYDFAMFKDFLGEIELSPEAILSSVIRGVDADTAAAAESNYESVFEEIVLLSYEGTGCNQIKFIVDNTKTLTYYQWRAGLSIAQRCVDGPEAIHLMSEDYPGYDRQQTIDKAADTHVHYCETFEEYNPGGCTGCQHKGKITTPITLGRRLRVAPVPTAADPPQAITALPDYMLPYVRSATGNIYYQPPSEPDENGVNIKQDPVLLSTNNIYPIKRVYNKQEGEHLLMRYCTVNDGEREFLLPMTSVYNADKFAEALVKIGLFFNPHAMKLFMGYFRQWGTFLFDETTAEIMRMQMGFDAEGKTFVIGDQEILSTGEVRTSAASPLISSIANLLRPHGSYDVWRRCANELNKPGMEMAALGLFCGFGSPLMRLTETPGVTLCFTSANSGVSKTGSLYAGQSVFGDPHELKRHGAKSHTDNALVGLYLALHSIMLGLDEVSNVRAETLAELIHRVSQGQGKLRMMGSVNAMREHEMSASLIAMFTSNKAVYDTLLAIKGSPDGELARIIEIHLKKPQLMVNDPLFGKRVFGGFRANFGFAGPEYIKHYFKVGEPYVRAMMLKWTNKFIDNFGSDTAFRFYESFVAATMTGGELAREAGIIDIDVDRIYVSTMQELIELRDGPAKLNSTDYGALIGEFYNKYQTGVLVLNEDRVVVEPKGPLVARGEIHNQVLYISKSAFKHYLEELKISSREFESATFKDGTLIGPTQIRLSTGWKNSMNLPNIRVYKFKCEFPEEILDATV